MSWPAFWRERNWKTQILRPLGALVCWEAKRRLEAFRKAPPERAGRALVIVVGNIVVGGSGKTPFILWLSRQLKQKGLSVGIISRGYGGKPANRPQEVNADSDPSQVGDEPVLLAKQLGCPVVVSPKRMEALKLIESRHQPDVVISDDGLQHYALPREIEIVLVDAKRRFGNGLCLPAGPLREPASRLEQVKYLVCNGGDCERPDSTTMQLNPSIFRSVADPARTRPVNAFSGQSVEAVAGIGNPARFFDTLKALQIQVHGRAFADHYAYRQDDFNFLTDEKPLLMTEKDAVKCRHLAKLRKNCNWWYLEVTPQVSREWFCELYSDIEAKRSALKNRRC